MAGTCFVGGGHVGFWGALVLISGMAPSASAETWTGAVSCNRLTSVDKLIDVSAQYSHNSFGAIDQNIGGVSFAYGDCVTQRARLRIEGSYAEVNEEGRHSRAALIGAGVQMELNPRFAITPIVHVGFEQFGGGKKQFLINGGVIVEGSMPFRAAGEGTALNFALRPEYTDRRTASETQPGGSRHRGSLNNTALGAIDFKAGENFRAKISLVHQYIGNAAKTDNIGSVVLSLRRSLDTAASYRWNIDLWGSRGSGGYKRVLLAVSYRFGFGKTTGSIPEGPLDRK